MFKVFSRNRRKVLKSDKKHLLHRTGNTVTGKRKEKGRKQREQADTEGKGEKRKMKGKRRTHTNRKIPNFNSQNGIICVTS